MESNEVPSPHEIDGEDTKETFEDDLEFSWWTKQLGHPPRRLGETIDDRERQADAAAPSGLEMAELTAAGRSIQFNSAARRTAEVAPRVEEPPSLALQEALNRLEIQPLHIESPAPPLVRQPRAEPFVPPPKRRTNQRGPSATRQLHHQLRALRHSRSQPYVRARQACGYLLFFGLTIAITWLIDLLVL